MTDPFHILGVTADSDDESVRRRYLELVKENPPEQAPEKFAAVRGAYESLRDQETRLRYRLFEAGKQETVSAIIEDVTCRSPRRLLSLSTLLALLKNP
jgi:DnaJ-class molecular chaperone